MCGASSAGCLARCRRRAVRKPAVTCPDTVISASTLSRRYFTPFSTRFHSTWRSALRGTDAGGLTCVCRVARHRNARGSRLRFSQRRGRDRSGHFVSRCQRARTPGILDHRRHLFDAAAQPIACRLVAAKRRAAPSGQDSRSADSKVRRQGPADRARDARRTHPTRDCVPRVHGYTHDLFFVRRDSADGSPAENQHDQEDDEARRQHPDHVDTLEDSNSRHRPFGAGTLDGDEDDDSALQFRVVVEIRGHPRSRFGVAVRPRQRKHLGLRRLEAGDQPLCLAPGGLLTRQLDQWTVSVPRLVEIRGGPVEARFRLVPSRWLPIRGYACRAECAAGRARAIRVISSTLVRESDRAAGLALTTTLSEADEGDVGNQSGLMKASPHLSSDGSSLSPIAVHSFLAAAIPCPGSTVEDLRRWRASCFSDRKCCPAHVCWSRMTIRCCSSRSPMRSLRSAPTSSRQQRRRADRAVGDRGPHLTWW